jgi:Zn-dependent protease
MLQVFRVAGIPVRVDVSWLLVFALISWSLATGYVPRVLPELGSGAAWLHGAAAAALLFACVLVHELSHALVALHHGVRVSTIRLHVFGGECELESEPSTPLAEAVVTLMGPLTSLLLAAASYSFGHAVTDVPWALALTGYLAAVNLILGLFNLAPALPLDGGRLLRAILWWWSGSQLSATRWAAGAGSLFGMGLIALGGVRLAGGELVGGAWFVVIGLVLVRAARSSLALARMRDRLAPVRIADVMTPLATTVDALASPSRDVAVAPDASAWQGYLTLDRTGAGRLAVIEAGRLVGVVSHRDLQHALAAEDFRADRQRRAA